MLTIFSTCKPFKDGLTTTIQRNAVRSWTKIVGPDNIILLGDEHGVREMAEEIGCRHETGIPRNEFGTPLLGPLFKRAAELARTDALCYVNADVILSKSILDAVSATRQLLSSFMLTGPRWTVDVTEELSFGSGWWKRLVKKTKSNGRQCQPTGLDYFAFTPDVYATKFRPVALGRYSWDNWLLWRAQRLKFPVVDATAVVMAIHQEHPRLEWSGKEVKKNLRLCANRGRSGYIWEADFALTKSLTLVKKDNKDIDSWRSMNGWTGDIP